MGIDDVLFGPHTAHSAKWRRAYDTDPTNTCPGKDPTDVLCKCPDLTYATKVNIRTGTTFDSRIYCGCCEHIIARAAPGGAFPRPIVIGREAKDEES